MTRIILAVLVLSVLWGPSALAANRPNAKKDAVDLVHKALTHIETVGLKQALADFKNSDNPFHGGALYLFVYDFDGNNLANSVPLNLPGVNLKDLRSPDGKLVIQQMIEMSKTGGGGAFEYDWINPQSGQVESKISYFKKIPNFNGFLGAGFYQAKQTAAKKEAIALVNKALAHIETSGLEQSLEDFKKPDNPFQDGELYVFVYDFGGENLANSVKLDTPSTNMADYRSPDGKLVIQQMIEMTKAHGGGAFEYQMLNPTTHQFQPKISYFKKIPGFDGFIGSGYYIPQTTRQ
ncbi:MAG: cache domain-containing protein [Gammaproteobacteria bacterium]|nr:cache domain-containing protein [Gammaproteobacteria bacterium]MCP5424618.1 cache domain-containing protein [Gammaproteobacteria bacterium]